ncbi:MAG: VapC toxin family PIN domain ribonuclease [Lautropia sp.]|nr:VapC toxin family PIN domain ribonuclease [Lautropia sp.]
MGLELLGWICSVSIQTLCERIRVLDLSYGVKQADIAATIRLLLDTRNVHADKAAVAVGLAMLDAGGEFGDSVIAHDGGRQGAEVFVSFDRKAVSLLKARGVAARLL